MIGRRMHRIINTGKPPAIITRNAGKKKYQPNGYKMRQKIKTPASKTREEMNHILADNVVAAILI
jgi:hypothetical protein